MCKSHLFIDDEITNIQLNEHWTAEYTQIEAAERMSELISTDGNYEPRAIDTYTRNG